jgi:hypothetical protein
MSELLPPPDFIRINQQVCRKRRVCPPTLGGSLQILIVRSEEFRWSEVVRGLLGPSTWLSAEAYFDLLSGIYSFGLFIPTIIVELGYTTNEAQIWSIIPYAVASVLTVIAAIISDRLKLRGVVMLFVLIPAIIGYAVIAKIDTSYSNVKYGMTCLMANGMYSTLLFPAFSCGIPTTARDITSVPQHQHSR